MTIPQIKKTITLLNEKLKDTTDISIVKPIKLEDISFNAGSNPMVDVVIDRVYVQNIFGHEKKQRDLKRYVL